MKKSSALFWLLAFTLAGISTHPLRASNENAFDPDLFERVLKEEFENFQKPQGIKSINFKKEPTLKYFPNIIIDDFPKIKPITVSVKTTEQINEYLLNELFKGTGNYVQMHERTLKKLYKDYPNSDVHTFVRYKYGPFYIFGQEENNPLKNLLKQEKDNVNTIRYQIPQLQKSLPKKIAKVVNQSKEQFSNNPKGNAIYLFDSSLGTEEFFNEMRALRTLIGDRLIVGESENVFVDDAARAFIYNDKKAFIDDAKQAFIDAEEREKHSKFDASPKKFLNTPEGASRKNMEEYYDKHVEAMAKMNNINQQHQNELIHDAEQQAPQNQNKLLEQHFENNDANNQQNVENIQNAQENLEQKHQNELIHDAEQQDPQNQNKLLEQHFENNDVNNQQNVENIQNAQENLDQQQQDLDALQKKVQEEEKPQDAQNKNQLYEEKIYSKDDLELKDAPKVGDLKKESKDDLSVGKTYPNEGRQTDERKAQQYQTFKNDQTNLDNAMHKKGFFDKLMDAWRKWWKEIRHKKRDN